MSEDSIEKALFLLLGWALGLLAPAIVEAIKRQREALQVRITLLGELHELKYRLAVSAYAAEKRFGIVDRPYLQWLRSMIIEYKGSKPRDSILDAIDMQLSFTDEQIAHVAKTELADSKGALTLKKYFAPLLDSRIPSLWYLDSRLQQLLLEVRSELNLLNEEIDQARYYFGLTFTNLDSENHSRVSGNLTESYRQIAKRARLTADKIGELETCASKRQVKNFRFGCFQ